MPFPEKALIAQVRRMVGSAHPMGSIVTGMGDDCAVLRPPPGRDLLVTTDFSLEGVHFRRDWHSAESVGHRCLARGLSDIAAMGGKPRAVFLSLALPRALRQAWVSSFMRGLLRLAKKYRVPLAGGDTAESTGGIMADIIVVGSVPKGKAILRSGARPGDRIYVSGVLGGSAAAVETMRVSGKKLNPRLHPRHSYPDPRIELGRILREKQFASSMIDLSDGLSTDLSHICEESRVGAEIDAKHIPRARVGRSASDVALDLALHGGEDYELLFTARPEKRIPPRIAGVAVTQIGRVTRSRRIVIADSNGGRRELKARGWEHFR